MVLMIRYAGCLIFILLLNGASFGNEKVTLDMVFFPEGEHRYGCQIVV